MHDRMNAPAPDDQIAFLLAELEKANLELERTNAVFGSMLTVYSARKTRWIAVVFFILCLIWFFASGALIGRIESSYEVSKWIAIPLFLAPILGLVACLFADLRRRKKKRAFIEKRIEELNGMLSNLQVLK
jgi:hypothetical protein